MRKNIVFVLISLFFILTACSISAVKTGRYVMKNAVTEDWSWIDIKDGNMYEFNRAGNVSYRPSGKYLVEGDRLILNVGDNSSYTFIIDGNSLIFESTTTNGNFIKKGTVEVHPIK